jgi:hypothetical protein
MAKGRGKKDDKPSSVFRCDLLSHAMNLGKQQQVHDLIRDWRSAGCAASSLLWRRFHPGGRFDSRSDVAKDFRKYFANARVPILNAIAAKFDLRIVDQPDEVLVEASEAKAGRRPLPTPPGLVDPMALHKESLGGAPVQMVVA